MLLLVLLVLLFLLVYDYQNEQAHQTKPTGPEVTMGHQHNNPAKQVPDFQIFTNARDLETALRTRGDVPEHYIQTVVHQQQRMDRLSRVGVIVVGIFLAGLCVWLGLLVYRDKHKRT